MEPLLRSLCDDADNFPKTIVYSKLKWCGNGYNMVCQEAAKESDPNAVIQRVSQYHSACTDQVCITYTGICYKLAPFNFWND